MLRAMGARRWRQGKGRVRRSRLSKRTLVLDFDDIPSWGPEFSNTLVDLVPLDSDARIRKAAPEYVEDALEILESEVCPNRPALVATTRCWIEGKSVAAYHGSRLSRQDIESIKRTGLKTLCAEEREQILVEKLSQHPDWAGTRPKLGRVIQDLGNRSVAGKRVGQVHATLSRSGIVSGFNHYLTHGSEFDQQAARLLLGNDGLDLLATYGSAQLVTLALPGKIALETANPYFHLNREMPNLVREVLTSWAYWLVNPTFSPRSLRVDCGFIFQTDVPSDWIVGIETIEGL